MRRLPLLLLPLILVAAACRPGVTPGTPESVFNHADGYAAVEQEFARFGPFVVAQAHTVATCESNHWPYAGFGKTYKGVFQLGPHYEGTLNRAASELGRWPTWYDPHVNARAAAHAYEQAHGWGPWTCKP